MENVKEWNYRVIRKIGSGGYGVVYQCVHRRTKQKVAIKMITKDKELEDVPAYAIREVSLLIEMKHDNVVRLLDVHNSGKYVYLVFECLDLDLRSLIRNPKFSVDLPIAKAILKQILLGLAYCHSIKVIHRDLNPANILIDLKNNRVKLADFGLARDFALPLKDFSRRVSEVDTPYKAPELLLEDYKYSTPIDVWAAGCIFVEITYGTTLFSQKFDKTMDLLFEIFSLLGTPNEQTWPGLASVKYLPSFPQYRPMDFADFFHDLKPAGIDLLSRIFCLDPDKRITADEALNHPYLQDVQNVPFIKDRSSDVSCHCLATNTTPKNRPETKRSPLIQIVARKSNSQKRYYW